MTDRILFIDDEAAVLRSFGRVLGKETVEIDLAENARTALEFCGANEYAVIATDYRMPDRDGLDLIPDLRDLQPHATYMLVSGECDLDLAKRAVNDLSVAFVITKPWEVDELRDLVRRGIEAFHERKWQSAVQQNIVETSKRLEDQKKKLEQALARSEVMTAEMFLNALDLRDHETRAHCHRVAAYAMLLAQALDLRGHVLISIQQGALLHDLGKLAIPDSVLLKPGKLTEDEWEVMRTHSELGAKMLDVLEGLKGARDIVLQHHEQYNGTGYPAGLANEEICVGARIFSIADTVDAMMSDRPYRRGLPFEVAYEEVVDKAGSQFDPKVVDAFKGIAKNRWLDVHNEHPDEEVEGRKVPST